MKDYTTQKTQGCSGCGGVGRWSSFKGLIIGDRYVVKEEVHICQECRGKSRVENRENHEYLRLAGSR